MSPSIALRHVRALTEGSQFIASGRLQVTLLRSIEELCRKGLSDATSRATEGAPNVVALYPDMPRP
jgi:hypothetical protein